MALWRCVESPRAVYRFVLKVVLQQPTLHGRSQTRDSAQLEPVLTDSINDPEDASQQLGKGPEAFSLSSSAAAARPSPVSPSKLHTAAESTETAALSPTGRGGGLETLLPPGAALPEPAPAVETAAAPAPAAPSAAAPTVTKRKVKRSKGAPSVRWHPTTKRGVPPRRNASAAAGVQARRRKPAHIDLDVVGQTHRAYSEANDAVRHRKPPQKPKVDKNREPFDQEKWMREQMALTNAMNARYSVQRPTGEYLPKARKTQRAKQKPRQTVDAIGLRDLGRFSHGPAQG